MRHPRLTIAVMRGLRALVEHPAAGGPDDLELDDSTRAGRRAWADIQRAIWWTREKYSAMQEDRERREAIRS